MPVGLCSATAPSRPAARHAPVKGDGVVCSVRGSWLDRPDDSLPTDPDGGYSHGVEDVEKVRGDSHGDTATRRKEGEIWKTECDPPVGLMWGGWVMQCPASLGAGAPTLRGVSRLVADGEIGRREERRNHNRDHAGRAVLRHGPISTRCASCTREGGRVVCSVRGSRLDRPACSLPTDPDGDLAEKVPTGVGVWEAPSGLEH